MTVPGHTVLGAQKTTTSKEGCATAALVVDTQTDPSIIRLASCLMWLQNAPNTAFSTSGSIIIFSLVLTL